MNMEYKWVFFFFLIENFPSPDYWKIGFTWKSGIAFSWKMKNVGYKIFQRVYGDYIYVEFFNTLKYFHIFLYIDLSIF